MTEHGHGDQPSDLPPIGLPPLSRLTRGIRHGLGTDRGHHAIVPPWYPSTNYRFSSLDTKAGDFDYARTANPTRDLFGEALATLEGGAGCVVVTSGMAAATLVVNALVPNGGRVVAPHDLYGGCWRLFTRLHEQGRIVVEYVDLTDLAAAREALSTPADLVWIESPSNPLLRLTDIEAVTGLAREAGALSLVDNTFCSPLLQTPLALGADLVLHSTTKFINGHSDVLGGAVISSTTDLDEQVRTWANTLGLTASPFDSWLALRGLRTLDARLRVHAENAAAVVDLLRSHPAAKTVNHPGFGSVLSFDVGSLDAAARLVDGLRCIDLAESLGGVESLICHPGLMTHASMPPHVQDAAGITPGLLRLSIGIEGADDLVADLRAGLDRARTLPA
ncbi:trans-sulfuration enzyme family protein [Aestuariimicrobium ganziense]|uniref:trans-sulfuration enzyme family protein n=1 Tax=Aestuariimicrobium ganziense TaxID=2773677 RepID=UPI0019427273|nr:PLP-dependent aspartate aminotransferase family protein [Aestuariimicrobium ganziense]